jgi:hypothetical protein
MRHRYRELRVRWDREFESVFLQRRVTREPVNRAVGNPDYFKTAAGVVHLFAGSTMSIGGVSTLGPARDVGALLIEDAALGTKDTQNSLDPRSS